MSASLEDRLHVKQGRSIVRWTLSAAKGSLAVFVKRHFRHPMRQRLLAKFWPQPWASDAGLELHRLRVARDLGIPTPEPLACAEWLGGWMGLRSVLVVKELSGMLALHEALPLAAKKLPPAAFDRWKRGLVRELVRLVRLMHDHGHFHRDLYLCHFFVAEADCCVIRDDWTGRVVVIDFHRLTRRPLGGFAGRVKDLAQLLFSAHLDEVSNRDVVRFWRLYRGGQRSRLLSWLIVKRWRRYLRHNRRRANP